MRILLVEDDKDLCENIAMSLTMAGYLTDKCYNGADGLLYAQSQAYDVIILDRMLPEIDGLTLLQAIRKRRIQTPVILATALDRLNDKIDGLDSGADDYIIKPFAVEELLARIRAVTRRPGRIEDAEILSFNGISLNASCRQLFHKEVSTSLSKKETALLEYLMRNAGKTLHRTMILSYIWGASSEVEDGNLDNYIYFLRRRLKSIHAPVKLTTVHGVGYRLEENND